MKKIWTALFILLGMGLPVLAQHVGPIFPAATLAIGTGGTWQVLFAANANRTTLWIQNYCTATSQGITTAESLFVCTSCRPGWLLRQRGRARALGRSSSRPAAVRSLPIST